MTTRNPSTLAIHRVHLSTTVEAEAFLAEGGMATVYRAVDRGLERRVAMKVMHPGMPALARAAFEHEAKLMARLDHPGIVSVHGLATGGDAQVFTMKLVEGRTLTDLVDPEDPPRGRALEQLLRSVQRMCETLAYAHDHGVVHRDLKPDNVMLGRYGECYIMDWGIALVRDELRGEASIERAGEIVGTPAFMAPEQAEGRIADIGPRTDVFGLGAILYYICTGHPPYTHDANTQTLAAAALGEITPPELANPGQPIPARLSDIVTEALAARPEHRFASTMALHAALDRFLHTGGWFTRQRVVPGELIIREGERGDRAYIVESGRCEVFRAGERGAETRLRELGPGEVIGELALFTAGARTASVRAVTAMTLLEVSRDALERELPQGSWTRQIVDTLAQRFVHVDKAWESARAPTPAIDRPPADLWFAARVVGAILVLTAAGMLLLFAIASM